MKRHAEAESGKTRMSSLAIHNLSVCKPHSDEKTKGSAKVVVQTK